MIKKYPIGGPLHGTVNRALEPARLLTFEPAFKALSAYAFSPQLFAQGGVSDFVEILEERLKERLQATEAVHRDCRTGHILWKLGAYLGNKRCLTNSRRAADQQALSLANGLVQPEAFSFAVDD